jgi:putative two-component system response regulator
MGLNPLAAVKKIRLDLMLLELKMPRKDGYDTCRCLKSGHSTLGMPVIFVTAKTDMRNAVNRFELDAVDYITKAVSPDAPRRSAGPSSALFLKMDRDPC